MGREALPPTDQRPCAVGLMSLNAGADATNKMNRIRVKMLNMKPCLMQTTALLLVFLSSCGKPEQFPRIWEKPEAVIRDRNCSSSECVAIISHSTLDLKFLPLTTDNHRRYARSQGYDYIFRNNLITDRFIDEQSSGKTHQLGLYWQKMEAIQNALDEMDGDVKRYKWVIWIDSDALFTNFDRSLAHIVSEHAGDPVKPTHSFLGSREPFHLINAGVLVFHNDEWSHRMIDKISRAFRWYRHQKLPEQDAIQDYVAGYLHEPRPGQFEITPVMKRGYNDPKLIVERARQLKQRVLNSFYGGWCPWACGEGEVWQPGDFVAHFAVVNDKAAGIEKLVKCFRDKGGLDYETNGAYKQCK